LIAIDVDIEILGLIDIDLDILLGHHRQCKKVWCCPQPCRKVSFSTRPLYLGNYLHGIHQGSHISSSCRPRW
jgi:hypothetical protein